MKSFWNERYAVEDYVYGLKPNAFFEHEIKQLNPGRILFPGEGEGRNAVYAAKLGWEVVAFDSAEQGKEKADRLAQQFDVYINYQVMDAADVEFEKESFDCVVLIFVHLPEENRRQFHYKMLSYLKPGGTIIFEGFEKKQLQLNSGGPRNLSMLFSTEDILADFSDLKSINIQEEIIEIDEGIFHNGPAQVIRFTGIKTNVYT